MRRALIALLSFVCAQEVHADTARARPPVAEKASAARQSLAGHYYLSGIREVGSELLLKPDARFEWMLAYGAMDQSASGTWRVEGSTLTLTSERPASDGPLAVRGPFVPWDVEAENALRRQALAQAQLEVAAQCPFLVMAESVSWTPMASRNETERERVKAAAVKELPPGNEKERTTRAQIEAVAAAAMSETRDKPAAMTRAIRAYAAWRAADMALDDLYDRAGLQRPGRAALRLPAACTMPALVQADPEDSSNWTGRLGVWMRFDIEDYSVKPMMVTFHFAHGADLTLESDEQGYAFLPATQSSKWTSISFPIPMPDGVKTVTVPAPPPLATGVQMIMLQSKMFVPAPFETMRLTIDGQQLKPEGNLARGSYSRQ